MTAPTEPLTPPWAYYRRTGLSEMRPYVFDEDLTGISVSEPDLEFMSICAVQGRDPGGYIARNPKNHADQWYVAQAYFDENLEPADTPARDDAAELRAALREWAEATRAAEWFELDQTNAYGDDHIDAEDRVEAARRVLLALAATEGSE